MASYSATTAKHATLTAATVDTVNLQGEAVYYGEVEVLHRGTADPIFFTIDGTAPTVAGDNTYVVMPGASLKLRWPSRDNDVKLISAGAVAYSVTAL